LNLWHVQIETDEGTGYMREGWEKSRRKRVPAKRHQMPFYIEETLSEEVVGMSKVDALKELIEFLARSLLHRFNASEQIWEFIKSRKLQLGFVRVMGIVFDILPDPRVRLEFSEDPEDPDFNLIAIEVDVSSPEEALRVSKEFARRRANLPDDEWLAFCLAPNVRRSDG